MHGLELIRQQAMTSRTRPHRLDMLGGRLREVRLYELQILKETHVNKRVET